MTTRSCAAALALLLPMVTAGASWADDTDKTFDKAVLAGRTIEIETYRHLESDCRNAGFVEIRVTEPPRNGSVKSEKAQTFSSFASDNPPARCNDRRTPSVRVSYSARSGGQGADSFSYEIYWVDGDVWKRRVNLSVR